MYLPKNYQQMRTWISTDLGRYVLQEETKVMCSILNNNFLKKILIIGEPEFALSNDSLLIDRNKSIYQLVVHPVLSAANQLLDRNPKSLMLIARQDKLPVDTNSIDIVILPHSLEMVVNPHEVLRESHRVLQPEGKIIITGFNCLSIWGIWKLIAKIFIKSPWRNNFFRISKLFDWLALLGFDEVEVNYYCHNLPINNQKILKKFSFLERIGDFMPFPLGNIYTVHACKRVIPLRPVFLSKWENIPLDDDELAKHTLKNQLGIK